MRKWVLFCALLLLLIPFKNVFAENLLPVVIIHQIRGSECCDKGDEKLENELFLDEKVKTLPLSFALRFDALQNTKLVEPLKKLAPEQRGILLEVTPQFASASGVAYKGDPDGSDWYQARNAFLIGYTPSERRKLIDTLIIQFKKTFASSPTFSVGWMVDADSLAYLRSSYGISIHELTKEQYETDNYTLYGGVFNMPYFADHHPLIPTTAGTLMLRQTVSDIEKNYGSSHAYFTSQPNDYLSNPDKQSFAYFTHLLDEAAAQPVASRFALLGLENSTHFTSVLDEYLSQLQYVANLQNEQKAIGLTPSAYKEKFAQHIPSGRYLKSTNFPSSGTLWYFGEKYRVRLESDGKKLRLTDLRLYPLSLNDPYTASAAAVSKAYWVAPYLSDSSQQFTVKSKDVHFEGNAVRTDSAVERFMIELGDIPSHSEEKGNELILKLADKELLRLSPTTLTFLTASEQVQFTAPANKSLKTLLDGSSPTYLSFDRHPRMVFSKLESGLSLGWEGSHGNIINLFSLKTNNNEITLTPNIDISTSDTADLASIFQPDTNAAPLDTKKTTVYWNNVEAIAGRNAVRVYIDPRNNLNRPVSVKNFEVKTDEKSFEVQKPKDTSVLFEAFFADISATAAASGKVSIELDGKEVGEAQIVTFYPNCIKEFKVCIDNLDTLKHWVRILLNEQFQKHQKTIERYKEKGVNFIEQKFKGFLPTLLQKPS